MNKTGKGGFGDNPHNINRAGRPNGTRLTNREILKAIGDGARCEVDMTITLYDAAGNKKIIHKKHATESNLANQSIRNALNNVVYSKALGGDIKFVREVYDREDGKPIQPLEHTGQLALDHFFNVLGEVEDEDSEQEDTEITDE